MIAISSRGITPSVAMTVDIMDMLTLVGSLPILKNRRIRENKIKLRGAFNGI